MQSAHDEVAAEVAWELLECSVALLYRATELALDDAPERREDAGDLFAFARSVLASAGDAADLAGCDTLRRLAGRPQGAALPPVAGRG
jgi:hypothetical protein